MDGCFRTKSEECWREKKRAEAASLDLSGLAREALELYLSSQTQWRTDWGHKTGLDYPGVEAVARALGFEWSRPVFARLRALEDESLVLESEDAEKEKQKQKQASALQGAGGTR